MLEIKTIDLWTEQKVNHYECYNACFVDGFYEGQPFDEYKIVKNCNCQITNDNKNINISNKHNAIIFYKNKKPVRLMVCNKESDVEDNVKIALSQHFKNLILEDIYKDLKIKSSVIDLKERAIFNDADISKEVDVGSCDRWSLLYNMLKGSYTESDTIYGNFQNDRYEFMPNINIKYSLIVGGEKFVIEHKCAFINALKTRIIPIQENSKLTQK